MSLKKFSFAFTPDCVGEFGSWNANHEVESFLENVSTEVSELAAAGGCWPNEASSTSIMAEIPALFSSTLGAAHCVPYEIELSDTTLVRSSLYRCAPPKLTIFREMVNKLMEQGVVRPSKSPYASPAFLVPKKWGRFSYGC